MITLILLLLGMVLMILCGVAIIFASPLVFILLFLIAVDMLVFGILFNGRGRKRKED